MDFATSVIPGWHTTIFPPYFVAGAIFSGFAMVLTLLIITRKVYKLEDYITIKHLELILSEIREARLLKANTLINKGFAPYAETFKISHSITFLTEKYNYLENKLS